MDVELAKELAQQTVYLMGISFLLGSLFTIFVLVILDMLRVARESREALAELDSTSLDEAAKE